MIMDIRNANFVADFMVIASADNYAQVGAIAGNIEDGLKKIGGYPYHTETDRKNTWMLLDYSDVIVHIFEEGTRKFYALERIWGDAKFIEVGGAKKEVVAKKKKVGGVKKNVGAGKAKPKARAKKSAAK